MSLLDTDVISELRRRVPDAHVLSWVRVRDPLSFFLSAVTVFELELGVRRVERRDERQGAPLRHWSNTGVLEQFRKRILSFDTARAQIAASFSVPDPRPDRDSVIAATAASQGLTAVTRNVRDFVPLGVPVIDPWTLTS